MPNPLLLWIVGFTGVLLIAHQIGPWAVTVVKYAFVVWVAYVVFRGLWFLIKHPFLAIAWVVFVLMVVGAGVWMNRNFMLLPSAKVIIQPIDMLLRGREQRNARIAARVEFLSKTVNATRAQQRQLSKIVDDCDSKLEVAASLGQREKSREIDLACADSMRAILTPQQLPPFDKLMAEIMPNQNAGAKPRK